MFGRIKIYTVHVNPEEMGLDKRPIFVKEGFNWAAFFFIGFWALYRRLWFAALVMFCVQFLLLYLLKSRILTPASLGAIAIGFHVITGYIANDLVRKRLSRKGYILADISAADSLLRAEQRYFERALAVA